MIKSFLLAVPGEGVIETYPSLQDQRFYGGFEKVTIKVSSSIFTRLAFDARVGRDPKILLARLYPSSPPVDGRDIIAPLIDYEESTITFSIKRGHYYLSSFMKEHDDPRFTGKHLTCSCHPGEEFPIFLSAFPNYQIESEKEKEYA